MDGFIFLIGVVSGILIGFIITLTLLVGSYDVSIDKCSTQGYFEYDAKVIKCQVIDKSDLIKRNLGE